MSEHGCWCLHTPSSQDRLWPEHAIVRNTSRALQTTAFMQWKRFGL